MKKTLLLTLLTVILVCSFALTACELANDGWGTVFTYETAYAEAQALGYTGSLQEFIDSIKGKDGANGYDGKDGIGIKSVLVNDQGKLIVTLTDNTVIDCGSVRGQQGPAGETGNGIASIAKTSSVGFVDIYTITYTNGSTTTFTVTNGAQGAQGQQGIQGIQGEPGKDGHTPVITIQNGYWYIDGVNTNVRAEGLKGDTGNGISSIEKTKIEGLVDTYTITFTDGSTTTFTVTNGKDGQDGQQGIQGIQGEPGKDGHTPVITIQDGYWYIDGVNTNVLAEGVKGETGNGISSIVKTSSDGLVDTYTITFTDGTTTTFTVTNGKDGQDGAQGIQGIQGEPGKDGHTPVITIQDGYWYIDGVNTNVLAEGIKGETGNGISSIEKTKTEGLVDTYTITFTDGSTTTFTVTNGKDGQDGQQGIQGIQGEPGKDGHTPVITIQDGYWYIDGVNTNVLAEGVKGDTGNGISSIEKTKTEGLVDTYTITYTDGSTTTFTVTNGKDGQDGEQGIQGEPGKDGHTPVITIQNGYWYVDGVNTNVLAQGIQGPQGEQGVSIVNTDFDENGNTIITYSDGTTQIIAHDWQKLYTLVQADCITEGKDLYSCVDCGLVRVVIVENTEHDYVESVIAPTCTSQGYTLHTCSICEDSYEDNHIETNGAHNFQESNSCMYCKLDIVEVAVNVYNMSATADDNVKGYVVARQDGTYDAYIKGTGTMKDYSQSPFDVDGYGLSNIYIENGVTSIGEGTFRYSHVVSNVVIPNSVTSIGSVAFADCSNLADITIEGSPRIGFLAFVNTSYFDDPTNWQNKVLYIGNCLIEAKTTIDTCTIKQGTTVIADRAFGNCISLISVDMPDSLLVIGEMAFYGCVRLDDITIPSSTIAIDWGAFAGCSGLSSITFAQPNYWYIADFDATGDKLLDLADVSKNATYLLVDYNNYYWYYTDTIKQQPDSSNPQDPTDQQPQAPNEENGAMPQLKIDADNYWYVSYDNGETWSSLGVQATGPSGKDGVGIKLISVNASGHLIITLTDDTVIDCGSVRGPQGEAGPQGPQGNAGIDGEDGITPQLKIGEDNYWYVSYDNGETWTSLGVKATGSDQTGDSSTVEHSWEKLYTLVEHCLTDGKDLYSCTDCGIVRVEVVGKTGHRYTQTIVEPTCTEKGYTLYTCDFCGENYVDEEVDALGHDYTSVKTPQTETRPAFTTYTCENCGDTYIQEEGILPLEDIEIIADYGFFYNETLNSYYEHQGIDFAAEVGAKVYAVFSGTIKAIYKDDLLHGTEVVISCDNGYTILYRFVDEKADLTVGQTVYQGQVIATVSEAVGDEYKTGSHLHLEVIDEDGKNIDPETVLYFSEK